jgi:hypothetical protein
MAEASKPFSKTSPAFNTVKDLIDQATNPVQPVW